MTIIDKVKEELKYFMTQKGDAELLATTSKVYKVSEILKELDKKDSIFYKMYNINEEDTSADSIFEKVTSIIDNAPKSLKDVHKPQKILMTRPNYEEATKILYSWEEPLVKKIRSNKISLIELIGSEDNRVNLMKEAEWADTVFLFGHGNSTKIAGHNDEIILDHKNVGTLKDKNVCVLACMSARVLGVDAVVSGGANFYYGYRRIFVFAVPPYDKLFEEAAMFPFYKMLNGGSLEKILTGNLAKYMIQTTKIPPGMFYTLTPVLLWDIFALEVRNPL